MEYFLCPNELNRLDNEPKKAVIRLKKFSDPSEYVGEARINQGLNSRSIWSCFDAWFSFNLNSGSNQVWSGSTWSGPVQLGLVQHYKRGVFLFIRAGPPSLPFFHFSLPSSILSPSKLHSCIRSSLPLDLWLRNPSKLPYLEFLSGPSSAWSESLSRSDFY